MFPRTTKAILAIYITISASLLLLGVLWLFNPELPAFAQSQPEALGTLNGAVHNAQNTPLPNITVWLDHAEALYPRRQTTTDGNGLYQFLSVPSGNYHLLFGDSESQYATSYYVDANFAADATNVTVNGNTVSGVNMVLEQAGSISVTVQDSAPLSTTVYQVTLFAKGAAGDWQSYRQQMLPTLAAGTRFAGLPGGNYRLCATGVQGYPIGDGGSYYANRSAKCYDNVLPQTYVQLAPDASDIHVQAGGETQVAITLSDTPQIQGYILAPNGQPQGDIYVTLYPATYNGGYQEPIVAESDDSGYFSLRYIERGAYSLAINTLDYTHPTPYLTVYYPDNATPWQTPTILVDASTRMSITTKLVPASQIKGKLTLPTGVPVNWVTILLYRQRADNAWSGPDECNPLCPQTLYDPATGAYTVTQVPAGRYRLFAQYSMPGAVPPVQYFEGAFYGGDGFDTADDVAVGLGKTVANINFIVGTHKFDASINGLVTAEGQAQAGIEVGLFTQYRSGGDRDMPFVTTLTDAQGHYKLEGLSTGSYRLATRDPNGIYATTFYSQPFTLPDLSFVTITQTDVSPTINITMTLGATIRGHVRTQHGAPAGGFILFAVPPYQPNDPYAGLAIPYVDERTDAGGYFEITGLPPGGYYLRAQAPSGSPDYPLAPYRYYPGTSDLYLAQLLTVEAGQTLENKDIFLFFTPTNFFPVIRNSSLTPQPAGQPTPTARPAPTPTPTRPPVP